MKSVLSRSTCITHKKSINIKYIYTYLLKKGGNTYFYIIYSLLKLSFLKQNILNSNTKISYYDLTHYINLTYLSSSICLND